MHIPRLDELLVRVPVLVILDGSERPRPRVRGFASAIENRVGSWKGLGLGERDALGVELSQRVRDRQAAAVSQDEADESDATEEETTGGRTTRVGGDREVA